MKPPRNPTVSGLHAWAEHTEEDALLRLWRAHPERRASILLAAHGATVREHGLPQLLGMLEVVERAWLTIVLTERRDARTTIGAFSSLLHKLWEETGERAFYELALKDDALAALADDVRRYGFDSDGRGGKAKDGSPQLGCPKLAALIIVAAGAFGKYGKRRKGESPNAHLKRVQKDIGNAQQKKAT